MTAIARMKVSENDVILGRGAGTRDHKGNRQFRSLVGVYREMYSNSSDKEQKDLIALEILNSIRSLIPPGRFMQPNDEVLSGQEVWVEVDTRRALGKIKQALREVGFKTDKDALHQAQNVAAVAAIGVGMIPGGRSSLNTPLAGLPFSQLAAPVIAKRSTTLHPWASVHTIPPSIACGPRGRPQVPQVPYRTASGALLRNNQPVYQVQQVQELYRKLVVGEDVKQLGGGQRQKSPSAMSSVLPFTIHHVLDGILKTSDTNMSHWKNWATGLVQANGHELRRRIPNNTGTRDGDARTVGLAKPSATCVATDETTSQSRQQDQTSGWFQSSGLNFQDGAMEKSASLQGGILHSPKLLLGEAIPTKSASCKEDDSNQNLRPAATEQHLQHSEQLREKKDETLVEASLDAEYCTATPTLGDQVQLSSEDVAAAHFLFSTLTETSKKTWKDLEQEKECLTKEEHERAVADMFGALCEIDPMRKRVKRGTPDDSASIKSLVRRMKRELDAIPTFKKLALLEAQETAEEREFSERRMELFLRREKLNVERASLRFVKYWEERRKLFGPSKFHLPLTLSGAMRDDVVALEKGVFHLVPGLDDSGRQVTVYIKRRHNRENYDTQSMVRVVWFFHELSALHPKAANGIVRLMYAVGATMWDIDLELEWMVTNLEQTAWPIPVRCNHGCCPPRLMAMLMRPIGIAQVDRDTRARVVFHDVPEDQLVEVLSDYGISAHLIPKEMGGFCEFGYRNIKPKLQRKLEEKLLQCEEFDWAEL